jgi:hypothetical protein
MLAVAMVALVASPAFAAVQNVKVGGSLKTTSIIRDLDMGADAALNKKQNVVLSQATLDVQADLTDNVSTVLQFVNERLWGTDDSSSNDANVELNAAYVTMKEILYAPLTVTVGRQPLVYGNALIIGDGDSTTNVSDVADLTGGSNFDAVKAVLNFDPLIVDLFAAKMKEGPATPITAQNDDDDSDLYGINAAFKFGGEKNVMLEGYLFTKMDKTEVDNINPETQKLYVPGLRVSANPLEGLSTGLEFAYQTGNGLANEDISAYAVQSKFAWAIPMAKDMQPGLSGGMTYLSGDKNQNTISGVTPDSDLKNWTPIAEDQFTGRLFDAIFGQQGGMTVSNLAFEIVPMQDLTAKISWYGLSKIYKDQEMYIYSPNSDTWNTTTQQSGYKDLGNEFDLDLTYAYTEDVQFGFSAGIFNPGKGMNTANNDTASQILTSVNVAF